jgi:hypothetical protein
MYIGISESHTSLMLKEEMRKTGLTGGDGLVLFGGECCIVTAMADVGRGRRFTTWHGNR